MRPRRLSLKARLLSIIVAVLIGGLLLGGAFILHNARTAVQAEMSSSMGLASRLVTTIAAAPGPGTDPELMRFLLEGLQDIRHVRVTITQDAVPQSRLEAPYPDAPSSKAPWWFDRLMSLNQLERPRVVFPRGLHGSSVAVIEAKPSDEIEEVWRDVRGLLILGGVLFVFLLGLLYWVVDAGLKPLGELFNGFQQLEDGNFDVKVAVGAVPELDRIHRKFNAMVDVLRKTMQDNRLLAKRVLNLQEEERRLLARDLHDEIGPYFFSIRADTSLIKDLVATGKAGEIPDKLDSINQVVVHLQELIKRLLRRLRPIVIDEHAILSLIETWRARLSRIDWRLEIAELPDALSDSAKVIVYRIVQESLTNVARHAEATRVLVKTDVQPVRSDNAEHPMADSERTWRLTVIVQDDGRGMPAQARFGLGLIGLQERVQALGGEFALHPVEPHGLRVEATIHTG